MEAEEATVRGTIEIERRNTLASLYLRMKAWNGEPPQALRGASDVARTVMRNGSFTVMREEPLVAVMDGFISSMECDAIIQHVLLCEMKAAMVSGDAAGEVSYYRTNTVKWVRHVQTPVFFAVGQRVALLLGLSDLSHAEMFQVIHYRPGAEYQTHYDAYDAASASGQRVMRRGGQRITTALCYLNTPKAGGATGFSEAGFDVKAERGRLLVFNNCSGDGVHSTRIGCSLSHPTRLA